MPFYRATIEVMAEAEGEGQVADLFTALLTENGIYHGDEMLRDWAYSYGPAEIEVSEGEDGHEDYFADGDLSKGLPEGPEHRFAAAVCALFEDDANWSVHDLDGAEAFFAKIGYTPPKAAVEVGLE